MPPENLDQTEGTVDEADPVSDAASEQESAVSDSSPLESSNPAEPASAAASEDTPPAAVDAPPEAQVASDPAAESSVELNNPEALPVNTLEGVKIYPEGVTTAAMEDVWMIEALGTVWVEIVIDGQIVTQRNLRKGMVRVYKYGNTNTLIVGDAGLLAVQDGSRFRERVGQSKSVVTVRNIGRGEILNSIEKKVGPVSKLME